MEKRSCSLKKVEQKRGEMLTSSTEKYPQAALLSTTIHRPCLLHRKRGNPSKKKTKKQHNAKVVSIALLSSINSICFFGFIDLLNTA